MIVELGPGRIIRDMCSHGQWDAAKAKSKQRRSTLDVKEEDTALWEEEKDMEAVMKDPLVRGDEPRSDGKTFCCILSARLSVQSIRCFLFLKVLTCISLDVATEEATYKATIRRTGQSQ
jgi:hypothetical protein